jgi:glycosyltransferase involved in cell wall biosynthesis
MAGKISVAMCTYNGAAHLREQLESITAQTRVPDELVVCDDRSTDDTVRIIESFAAHSPFPVRLRVNEQNLGSTKNFERAISLCEGDFIALADQDDVWLPEKLRRLEDALSGENTALAFTDGEVVDERLRPLDESVWQTIRFGPEEQRLFREGNAFTVLLDHNVVTGAAMAFKAKFKELILPIPNDLIHDGIPVLHDWWAALMISAVGDVSFCSESLFKYRQHSSQQMGVIRGNEDAAVGASMWRRNIFSTEIDYVRAIRERLSSIPQVRVNVLSDLEARLTHLETRAAMPERRLRRIAPVLRELVARRYHLYSNGLASAAKDFWL